MSVLSIDKYGHIVTVLHQGDLSTATPTQILGKINAHEIYMHITPQDGSSSTKKKDKDLAFKASQEKGKARLEYESSSDDEIDDASLALMVRRTAKMLKNSTRMVSSLMERRRNSSLVARGSPSPKWIAIIVENLVI